MPLLNLTRPFGLMKKFEGIDWVDLQRFHEKFDEAVKACQKY
jgi:hypothetical protein